MRRLVKALVVMSLLALGCPGADEPTLNNDTPSKPLECSDGLNPTCETSSCTLPSGGLGLCHLDSKLNCVCSEKTVVTGDPCISINNPKCEEKGCTTEDGLLGKCTKNKNDLCYCSSEEGQEDPDRDPCGEKLNPQCLEMECDVTDATKGTCKLEADDCHCVAPPPDDPNSGPCGKTLNPQCLEMECYLAGAIRGTCKLEVDNCHCVEIQDDPDSGPCGNAANPSCNPDPCKLPDDTDGKCESLPLDGVGEPVCQCIRSVIPTGCGSTENPSCESYECDTYFGTLGQCQSIGHLCICVDSALTNACSQTVNPECRSDDCTNSDGLKGRCLSRGGGPIQTCGCVVSPDSCNENIDCVEYEWPEDCTGRWVCESGTCKATCDGTLCGDQECSPEDGESEESCAADCNCTVDAECLIDNSFCKFPEGRCEGPGTCTVKWECKPAKDHVCGCNGQTYETRCFAYREGVSVKSAGKCPAQ